MERISSLMPVDAANKEIPNGTLGGTVLANTYNASISSAVSVSLNAATSSFEVFAFTQAALVRYQAGASTTNFDAAVPANTSRIFYRDPLVTTISVIQAAATGAMAVIER